MTDRSVMSHCHAGRYLALCGARVLAAAVIPVRVPFPVLVDLLRVGAQLDAYRSVLVEIVALAGQEPVLSDDQLRIALVGLGERVSRELGGAR